MANKERGEVELVTTDGKTYTLRFSIDAMCHMESALGMSVIQATQELADPTKVKVTTARAALWASLCEHHPMTIQEAGELIPACGGLVKVMEAVSQAILAAFPKQKGDARPRKAAGGTGSTS
jgi:hypothetical protein